MAMGNNDALQALESRLRAANQAFDSLLWAAVEDQPRPGPGHALVDHYETMATDAIDHARQAFARIRQSRRTPLSGSGVATAATALRMCAVHISALVECILQDLGSVPRIASLDRLAAERRGVWATWVRGVKDAIEECQRAVSACATALPLCWQSVLGQILPALNAPRVSATGAKIILSNGEAKVSNNVEAKVLGEAETISVTGRSSDATESEQAGQRA